MSQKQRDERLKELNQQCMECQERARKGFRTINPVVCGQYCQVGKEVHKLERPDWMKVDWNSSKVEALYHH